MRETEKVMKMIVERTLFASCSSVRYDGGTNDSINGPGMTTAKGAYCGAFAAS